MTAHDTLAALDALPASELCARAEAALSSLVEVMNQETTLLRAGRHRDAVSVTAEKTRLSQDYVTLARAIQRNMARLSDAEPEALDRLRAGHESLATQMAENLRVLAVARTITEDLLSDVSGMMGESERPKTYGRSARIKDGAGNGYKGIAVNRSL